MSKDGKKKKYRRVTISSETLDTLRREKARTGVGEYKLLREARDAPEGLTHELVNAWLSGRIATARQVYLNYMLKRWRSLPDDPIIPITPALRAEMKAEVKRTGLGPAALLRGIRPSEVSGLGSGNVRSWLSGEVSKANRDSVAFVLERWRALPSVEDAWMLVDADERERWRAKLKEAGVAQTALLSGRDDVPAGLTAGIVYAQFAREPRRLRREYYDYIRAVIEELPIKQPKPKVVQEDAQPKVPGLRAGYVPLTEDMRQALQGERDRTGVGERSLVAMIDPGVITTPVQPIHINSWLCGRVKSVPKASFEAVLAAWKALPDKNGFWTS